MSRFAMPKNQDPFSIQSDKYGNLDGFSYRAEWTEDSFFEGAEHREMVGLSFVFLKLKWIKIFSAFFLVLLLGRSFWLQIIKGDYYYSLAEGNRIRTERVDARRGIIYDRNFKPLVKNVANFVLYILPMELPKVGDPKFDENINLLVSILGDALSREKIIEEVSKIKRGSLESFQPLFIADNIEYDKAMLLNLEKDKMPGVYITSKTRRDYNLVSISLSHLLGYAGKISEEELKNYGEEYLPIDYLGKTGLEQFYENELKGVGGRKQTEVDALGREKKVLSVTPAEDGHNLLLSVDVDLQKKIEETTGAYLEKSKSSRASVIAMDPRNGEILALVSLPGYNNNLFSKGIKKEEYQALLEHPDRN